MTATVSKKTLLNISLALLLAALVALVIYEPGKTEAPEVKRLTSLLAGAVQEIRIHSPGRPSLLLSKQDGQWRMQTPLKTRANSGRIQQLLKITQAKSIARYAMSQVDANQLQLDAPSLSLQLDNVLLRFGSTDALGGSRYVQVGNMVHLITDRYSHLAKAAATDFVSPRLLPEGAVIDQLSLPGLRLQREGEHWLADGQTADADAIQTLLGEWRHARAMQVSALEKIATESVAVRMGGSAGQQTVQFSVLRNDTEIILQRHDLGIQYHFPKESGERLLALPVATAESIP